MKKFLSILMLASVLSATTYSNKSEAGVLILAPSIYGDIEAARSNNAAFRSLVGSMAGLGTASGIAVIIGGIVAATTGSLPLGIVLIVMDENGKLSQGALETTLAQRFDFIADREVIADLASAIKSKARRIATDSEGHKMVRLDEIKVRSILAPLDLTQEEVTLVVSDLN